MEILFQDKKLSKQAEDYKKCKKEQGEIRAKLFMKRIGDLYNAETLEDVRYLPGHYHELTGDRRSEERRVGNECSLPCRSRWSQYH